MGDVQRVALVTAATGGIGLAIARALLADGLAVVVSGRDAEKGRRVANDLREVGDAGFVQADAGSQSDTEGLVDRVLEQHGRLDVLVNNAGGASGFALLHELSDDAWRQALDLNLSSAFWTTRRALPGMVERRFGRIVNIGSVQGKQANRPTSAHYITAKHGLNGFTKAVALDYGGQGITCNAICVGAVETDLMRHSGPIAAHAAGVTYEQYKQRYADAAMTGRLTTVEDVAAMARLLASDVAGITGAILNVDGGTCPY